MEDPKIQFNPSASMRYEVIARIQGASGIFDSIKATADYQVSNERCVPMAPISGVKVAPRKRVELRLVQTADGTYQTVVYVDQLMDEDYFGRGTCHWSLVAASLIAVKGKTRFSAGIFAEKILAQSSESTYYSKNALDGEIDILDAGSTDRHTYADSGNTFAISLDAKELPR